MGDWSNAYKYAEEALVKKDTLEDFKVEGFKLPNHFQSVETINALELTLTSSYKNAVSVLPSFLAFYEEGDLRPVTYFAPANDKGNRACLKGGDHNFRNTIRVAELYLNSAEATAQSDNLSAARRRVLELMEKRYNPEAYAKKKTAVDAMNKTELVEEILKERASELAFEGQRWFDLHRTTRPRIEKVLQEKIYVLEQDDSRYALRIPEEAIASNPT